MELAGSQVIQVSLQTNHHQGPGNTYPPHPRQRDLGQAEHAGRPDRPHPSATRINSQVTSWCSAGSPTTPNTDENNAVIEDIGIQNANPELGIPEDTIVIGYRARATSSSPAEPAAGPPAAHDFSPGTLANIDHIVVLTKENRSFDHMLGYLSLPARRAAWAGTTSTASRAASPTRTTDASARRSRWHPGTRSSRRARRNGLRDRCALRSTAARWTASFRPRPRSSGPATAAPQSWATTRRPTCRPTTRSPATSRSATAGLPAHPGPTFPNRFYELTGRPNLDTLGVLGVRELEPARGRSFIETIFDHLTPIRTGRVTWRYFEHGYCFLRFFERYTFDSRARRQLSTIRARLLRRARQTGSLPRCRSSTLTSSTTRRTASATSRRGHPHGQALSSDLVEAVVAGPAWDKTLLLDRLRRARRVLRPRAAAARRARGSRRCSNDRRARPVAS